MDNKTYFRDLYTSYIVLFNTKMGSTAVHGKILPVTNIAKKIEFERLLAAKRLNVQIMPHTVLSGIRRPTNNLE